MSKIGNDFCYGYEDTAPTWVNTYLWPVLIDILAKYPLSERRAFDLGCGNGATASMLFARGYDVTGYALNCFGGAGGQRLDGQGRDRHPPRAVCRAVCVAGERHDDRAEQ